MGRTAKAEIYNWTGNTPYATTSNTYNARDQITLIRQTDNATGVYQDTSLGYDGHGRLQSKHVPEQDANTATTFTYNTDDTLKSVTDARLATATYDYNGRHLLKTITHPNPSQLPAGVAYTPNVTFIYDAAGNRSSATQKDNNQVVLGSMSYQYDELSRLTSESSQFADLAGTYALNYGYNLANELTSLSIPFTSQAIGYNYDTAGRLNSVSASGFSASYTTPWPAWQTFTQTLTSFISNITYRAWGGRKSVTYGNTVSESTGYNARLQPTSYTLSNVNYTNTNVWPNQSFSSMNWTYDYYADGRANHAYDSTWNFWDRSYSYDHVGRLQEANTNRVARGQSWDFWHPDPYKQTSTHDVWNNLKLTGYLYNNQQNDWSSYTNNRRSDMGYDAAGNVKWNPGYNNTIDAGGLNVSAVATRNVGDGTTEFPTQPAEEITQTYGTDGRPGKRVDVKRENIYDGEEHLIQVLEDNQTKHYIYSSVLGARVVELDSFGLVSVWVFADGQRIATASAEVAGPYLNTTFEHHNPGNCQSHDNKRTFE